MKNYEFKIEGNIKEDLSEEDIIEMARYIAHLEDENKNLIHQLKEHKAYLLATLQQRASAEGKVKELNDKLILQNSFEVQVAETISSTLQAEPIEQYRIKKGMVSKGEA